MFLRFADLSDLPIVVKSYTPYIKVFFFNMEDYVFGIFNLVFKIMMNSMSNN